MTDPSSPATPPPPGDEISRGLAIQELFERSPYLSIKVESYFQVYEQLFRKFVGREVTFVEVGVLNGGSLFMWREYLGPQARIIGVDFNPEAKRWEASGFEIFIADQSDETRWEEFYRKYGEIDVLLDDGGHSNKQQIVTVIQTIDHVRDGGLIVVEDTHASYMAEFGNPSRYSFNNFAAHVMHAINRRFLPLNGTGGERYWRQIFSVQTFASIVVFHINRSRCFLAGEVRNQGKSSDAVDFRIVGTSIEKLQRFRFLRSLPLARKIGRGLRSVIRYLENRKLQRFFR